MIGKNLLWTAKQHGHGVQVMLNMYAAWLEGATAEDVAAIQRAMDTENSISGEAISAELSRTDSPLEPPRAATRQLGAPRKSRKTLQKEMAERVGFEPTCRFYPTIRFRIGAVMTASVPLRHFVFASRSTVSIRFQRLLSEAEAARGLRLVF